MRLATILAAIGIWALCLLQPGAHAQSTHAASVREADAACAQCHQAIFKEYLETPMSNASGLATERLIPGTYEHPQSGVEYSISKDRGAPTLRYKFAARSADGSSPGTAVEGNEKLEYFLGSGHLGLTYLYEKSGYWFESPIAYYDSLGTYAMKPGLETSRSMPAGLTLNASCLRCHMSGVQPQVAGTDNLYRGLPFLQAGITCESCHGDTRAHVASAGKASVTDPAKLPAARRDSVCIVCHLEGETNVERSGRNVLDYTPGDNISDYLSYFVYDAPAGTRRAVSEVEQFSSSRCKLSSGAGMSCMACHDPHTSPAPAQRVLFYRQKCLACHGSAGFATQHFPATPDCTGCHMPKTGSQNIAHVAWTDHRILRRPMEQDAAGTALPGQAAARTQSSTLKIVALAGAVSTPRELGLAYYNLAVKGVATAKQNAQQQFAGVSVSAANDPVLLRSLGILAQMDGDTAQAATYYRATLRLQPDNLAAGTNLGTLLARAGDLRGAALIWEQAFARNQDVPELGQNLALARCRLGQREQAEQVLSVVLAYSPGLQQARHALQSIESGAQPCAAQALPRTPEAESHKLLQ